MFETHKDNVAAHEGHLRRNQNSPASILALILPHIRSVVLIAFPWRVTSGALTGTEISLRSRAFPTLNPVGSREFADATWFGFNSQSFPFPRCRLWNPRTSLMSCCGRCFGRIQLPVEKTRRQFQNDAVVGLSKMCALSVDVVARCPGFEAFREHAVYMLRMSWNGAP